MNDLRRVRLRRYGAYGVAFACVAACVGPVFVIRPDLVAVPAYLAFAGIVGLLATWGLHHTIFGPMAFMHAGLESGTLRRCFDRIFTKCTPVFRVSPRSTHNHVQVQQYLWNGWTTIHQDQQFENVGQMQLHVRDWSARCRPFIGPEFTGDDLLVVDENTGIVPLSLRCMAGSTSRAHAESRVSRRQLVRRRLSYLLPVVASLFALIYGADDAQHIASSANIATMPLMGAGLATLVVVTVLAWSAATRSTRRRWWTDVQHGRRGVRYRLVREANEDRYWVQVFSVSEWRTKSHLNSDEMIGAEAALETDVRELKRVVATNQATQAAHNARARLMAPFSVSAAAPEALSEPIDVPQVTDHGIQLRREDQSLVSPVEIAPESRVDPEPSDTVDPGGASRTTPDHQRMANGRGQRSEHRQHHIPEQQLTSPGDVLGLLDRVPGQGIAAQNGKVRRTNTHVEDMKPRVVARAFVSSSR